VVDVSEARVVAVLARAPSAPGKRRLFAALGVPPDPALRAALLLDTLDGVAASGVRRVVAVEPAASVREVRALVPPDVDVMPQAAGDLGARMRAVMADLFARGALAVAVVGSDLPDIHPGLIGQAFSALGAGKGAPGGGGGGGLVLGPAEDGGYYLVAATRLPPVFDRIAWGSARVLDETLSAAAAAGLFVHLIDAFRDVDDVPALLAVRAPRTAAWAATWLAAQSSRTTGAGGTVRTRDP
jgi:rSAM/selenodomain-associated transferase 1